MDYINTTTFEIQRGRNIPDKTGWIAYNEGGVELELPDCEKKYYKYINDEIKEMTTAQKTTKDHHAI